MRNEIIEKAQELGKMIADSGEKEKVLIAEERMNNDAEAVELLRIYNENRKNATAALRGTNPTKEQLKEFHDNMQAEFEKIMKNEFIAEYIAANKEFESMVQQVNAVLTYFITGQEQEGGCSGSCSTCGGCH